MNPTPLAPAQQRQAAQRPRRAAGESEAAWLCGSDVVWADTFAARRFSVKFSQQFFFENFL